MNVPDCGNNSNPRLNSASGNRLNASNNRPNASGKSGSATRIFHATARILTQVRAPILVFDLILEFGLIQETSPSVQHR